MQKYFRGHAPSGRRTLAMVTTAMLVGGSPLWLPASATAAASGASASAAPADATQVQESLKLSRDGFNALRSMRMARVAIFDGDIDMAKKQLKQAEDDMAKVKADEKALKEKGERQWVAVDGQLVVADDYVGSPEKNQHIAAGNEKLKKGQAQDALEEFRLADVDIGFSRLLLPVVTASTQVAAAQKLLDEGKYYESNMALKKIEDALQVDSVDLLLGPSAKGDAAPAKSEVAPPK